MPFPITIEEYMEYSEAYIGICQKCGEERPMTEPDAEDYDCHDCGERAVKGVDTLLAEGLVE